MNSTGLWGPKSRRNPNQYRRGPCWKHGRKQCRAWSNIGTCNSFRCILWQESVSNFWRIREMKFLKWPNHLAWTARILDPIFVLFFFREEMSSGVAVELRWLRCFKLIISFAGRACAVFIWTSSFRSNSTDSNTTTRLIRSLRLLVATCGDFEGCGYRFGEGNGNRVEIFPKCLSGMLFNKAHRGGISSPFSWVLFKISMDKAICRNGLHAPISGDSIAWFHHNFFFRRTRILSRDSVESRSIGPNQVPWKSHVVIPPF
jgi:hypothetical protein